MIVNAEAPTRGNKLIIKHVLTNVTNIKYKEKNNVSDWLHEILELLLEATNKIGQFLKQKFI